MRQHGFHSAGNHVWTKTDPAQIRVRIRAADLFVSDVDECMFPFIGQAEAARHALIKTIGGVTSPADARFAAAMLSRAAAIVANKLFQKATGNIRNSVLIKQYEKLVMHVPMRLLRDGAAQLIPRAYRGVPETFKLFTDRGIPAGAISLGLDFFLFTYREYLEKKRGVPLAFAECTHTLERDGKFAGYDKSMLLLVPEDKARLLRARVNELGSSCPIAVGHDLDDLELFRAARELGGIAIGFNPLPETFPLLDAAIFAPDWTPLFAYFENALQGDTT